jgi:hypothetical protein
MANIAASDITVTPVSLRRSEDARRIGVFTLAFGDGALTYPAGGVPITKAVFGCPNIIESLTIFDSGTSGYKWSYDRVNEKLVAMQAPAQTHAHDLLIKGGQAASTTNNTAHYATDILGKEAATDATIAGSASATKGGVMSSVQAAAALVEPSAVAIAAQSLKIEVVGW